ncbi:hypothetical protein P7C70_g6375, partial [Phenoliferia sp. Uapishka_3]
MSIDSLPLDPGARSSNVPLQPTGVLDKFEHADLTPVIGRQFRQVNLAKDLIDAENSDELLRELAICPTEASSSFATSKMLSVPHISRRYEEDGQASHGQPNRIIPQLVNALGVQSGRPAASSLHIHPTEYRPDPELSPMYVQCFSSLFRLTPDPLAPFHSCWHTDITFEPIPSNYAVLNMYEIPPNGGDTAYDRLTPAFAKFLEGLHAEHSGNGFHARAAQFGIPIYEGAQGHPENAGKDLVAIHPVIRTDPVTGYKGLFVNKAYENLTSNVQNFKASQLINFTCHSFTTKIVELSKDESDIVLAFLFRIVTDNHDLQTVGERRNDVAIWTNTSTFHNVTVDYEGSTVRKGNRAVSIGERPFFDPNSKSRREALGLPAWGN